MGVSPWVNGAFIFFDFLFLATAVVFIVISAIWNAQSTDNSTMDLLLRNLIITSSTRLQGLVCGVFVLLAFLVATTAFVRRFNNRIFLPALYGITISTVITVICGTIVWFQTLVERAHFSDTWLGIPSSEQGRIQDFFQCCGYWSSNLTSNNPVATSQFCPTPGTGNSTGPAVQGCVGPFTSHADTLLNTVFTIFYIFVVIDVAIFFATVVVMKARGEQERYRRIEEKRGGAMRGYA